jgi:hypothetical protein
MMLPDPVNEGREVLHICRTDDPRLVSNVGGAVWNFPAAKKGSVTVNVHVGGKGLRLSLLDHWINPCDEEVKRIADFTMPLNDSVQDESVFYTRVRVDFDCAEGSAEVYVNERFLSRVKLRGAHPNGLCYLHLQSLATEPDLRGALVAELGFAAKEAPSLL